MAGLEDVDIPGREYLKETLTNCADPLKAIAEFQEENGKSLMGRPYGVVTILLTDPLPVKLVCRICLLRDKELDIAFVQLDVSELSECQFLAGTHEFERRWNLPLMLRFFSTGQESSYHPYVPCCRFSIYTEFRDMSSTERFKTHFENGFCSR